VTYADWNLVDDQARRLHAIPFPQSRESVRRFAESESVRGPENDRFRFVIETAADEKIGDVTTHDSDSRTGTFSYGLNILPEHRRRGYASEAIMLVLRYFFWELRYQKDTVGI
jgi:RimJ/RimL family protein N-acetyltransferase